MNTIAETGAGFDSVTTFKLRLTHRKSVSRFNAVKTRNDQRANDNGGKYSGKEERREFIVQKLFDKNAETRIKQTYSVP
jgi:hypothetical protein